MLTIMAAMEQELAGLRRELRRLPDAVRWPDPLMDLVRNGSDASNKVSPPVELRLLGIGKESVQANFRNWLDSRGGSPSAMARDEVLLLGFAGATDPALKAGDLVLPSHYHWGSIESRPSINESKQADEALEMRALAAADRGGIRLTRLDSLTVDRIVSTPEGKRATRAKWSVGIVDMEDYWVAEAAAAAGIPFLAVRAVVDTASQTLPAYIAGLAEHPGRAVGSVAVQPWRLPVLLRLRNQMRQAQKSLTSFALAFLALQPLGAQRHQWQSLPVR